MSGGGQSFKRSDTKPTEVASLGDVVFNSSPQPNGFAGWIYTALGWLGFGVIENVSASPMTLSDGTQFMVKDESGVGTPFLCIN